MSQARPIVAVWRTASWHGRILPSLVVLGPGTCHDTVRFFNISLHCRGTKWKNHAEHELNGESTKSGRSEGVARSKFKIGVRCRNARLWPILNFERATLLEYRNAVTFPLFHGTLNSILLLAEDIGRGATIETLATQALL